MNLNFSKFNKAKSRHFLGGGGGNSIHVVFLKQNLSIYPGLLKVNLKLTHYDPQHRIWKLFPIRFESGFVF